MSDVPKPDEIESLSDVLALFENLRARDIDMIDTPDGQTVWIFFTETTYYEQYRFEVNLHSGSRWLHHETDDGPETVWKKARKTY